MDFSSWNRSLFNRMLQYGMALSITTSLIVTSTPLKAYEIESPNYLINEILFLRKVKALKKEAKKLEGLKNCKDTKKIIRQLFKVKKEAENVSGIEVNVVYALDEAQEKLRQEGSPLSDKQYKAFKKILKHKGKNLKDHEKRLLEILITDPMLLLDDKLWEPKDGMDQPVAFESSPELAYGLALLISGIVVFNAGKLLQSELLRDAGKILIFDGCTETYRVLSGEEKK